MYKLYLPLPLSQRTQGFNENANPLYEGQGLKGHTSDDWGGKYDSPVRACADKSFCYTIKNKDNPDPSKYRGVYTLVDKGNGLVDELSYGHANKIYAQVGKTYNTGDILMTMGNTGDVYVGSTAVTKEARLKGSKAGTHLHGVQVRACKYVDKMKKGKTYLYDGFGVYKRNGKYIEVLNYKNGFNGCVKPEYEPETAEEIANKKITIIHKTLAFLEQLRAKIR